MNESLVSELSNELHVERLSEGRCFARRRVQVRLEGRVLCEVSASFTTAYDGVDYQDVALDPEPPEPEALMPDVELAKITTGGSS
jgi:acyl-CoA thioesterase